jgi:carboxypeptidase PM20D1
MHYYRDYRKKKKKRTGTILAILFVLLLGLLLIIVFNTITYPFVKYESGAVAEQVDTVSHGAIRRLAGAIRIPTLSEGLAKTTDNPFDRFKVYLSEAYPEVHRAMDTLTVNKHGLLFHWKGKDASRNPVLFVSHCDVAPVAGYGSGRELFGDEVFRPGDATKKAVDSSRPAWDFPPFSGAVAGGRVYGRGALDAKSMLLAQLEAATTLLIDSFRPEQDIWFACGFDRETGGTEGAAGMAAYFKQKNMTFDAVYDGGSAIVAPGVAGVSHPLALVGVAEKGFCTIHITVRGTGGHAFMPPCKSAPTLAAEIIGKLNDRQFPVELTPEVKLFLDRVGESMDFVTRMTIANQWLLEIPLLKILEQDPATNALVRTTTAVTMIKGSDAPNMLPATAEITVNFHILTGGSVEMVVNHLKEICDGYDVDIRVGASREPSGFSAEDTRACRAVRNALARFYPEAQVVTYISLTATDARKYETVSKNIYRIMPVCLNEYELRTIRNENEHISLENYGRMIAYYKDLMERFETVE